MSVAWLPAFASRAASTQRTDPTLGTCISFTCCREQVFNFREKTGGDISRTEVPVEKLVLR